MITAPPNTTRRRAQLIVDHHVSFGKLLYDYTAIEDAITRALDEQADLIKRQREALEAARVFITPLQRLKPEWDEYKQDAADRITAALS